MSRYAGVGGWFDGDAGGPEQRPVAGRAGDDAVSTFVDGPVVGVAEADQVGQAGRPAVGPVPDVMDLRRRRGAPRRSAAAAVAGMDGAAEPAADPSGLAAEVQRSAVDGLDQLAGRAVAAQPAPGRRVDP